MLQSKVPCMHSYSASDVIGVHENPDSYIFKKFINAAIYVEKSIKKLEPDLSLFSDNMKIMKTKRCTCWIDANSCSFHFSMAYGDGLTYTKSENPINLNNGKVHRQFDIGNEKLIEIREKQRLINRRQTVSVDLIKNEEELFEFKDDNKYSNTKLDNIDEPILPKTLPSKIRSKIGERNNNLYQRTIKQVKENISEPRKEIIVVLTPISENQLENIKEDAIEEENLDDGSTSSSPSSSTLTGCTVKRNVIPKKDMRVSLTSMTSCRLSENESVKQWLEKKLEEQKKRKMALLKEKKRKEIEREKILEKERENFKLWLAEKKKIEEKKKSLVKKDPVGMSILRELDKEKKYLQCQIEYQNWLKKKNLQQMEKENNEHKEAIQNKVEKDRKTAMNQQAFENWLKSAKNKPKPIPLNRGLDSLRSSVSVTYINPVPWVPNIPQKPASQ